MRVFILIQILVMMPFISHGIVNEVNIDSIVMCITSQQLKQSPNFGELSEKTKLSFSELITINQKCDTIFITESISDYGTYEYISIWNKSIGITVNGLGSKHKIVKPLHPNTETIYIQQWNVKKLLDAGSSVNIYTDEYFIERKGVSDVWTTRIIITNGQVKYETIHYLTPWFPEDNGYSDNSIDSMNPRKTTILEGILHDIKK